MLCYVTLSLIVFAGRKPSPLSHRARREAAEEQPAQRHAQGDHAGLLLPGWVLSPQRPGNVVCTCLEKQVSCFLRIQLQN